MTRKFAVSTNLEKTFVVRFYPSGREQIAKFEPSLLLRMHALGLKVPAVIAFSEECDPHSVAYVAYEKLRGESMDRCLHRLSVQQISKICSHIQEQTDLLASLPVLGFGDLLDSASAKHAGWKSFMLETLSASIPQIAGVPEPLWRARATLLDSVEKYICPSVSALTWADISPENVIIGKDGKFVGLIDFEGTLALEPLATLGYLKARYEGTAFYRAFLAHQEISTVKDHRVSLYAVVRALRITPYLQLPLPAGQKRDPLEVFLPGLRSSCEDIVFNGGFT
jgi:aminoglycoside phosphotransferase (APT) family kinase protein